MTGGGYSPLLLAQPAVVLHLAQDAAVCLILISKKLYATAKATMQEFRASEGSVREII